MTIIEKANPEHPVSDNELRNQWIELALTTLVLAILSLFAYTNIFLKPHLGFSMNLNTGFITGVDPGAEDYVQINDKIATINGIPYEEVNNTIRSNPFIQTEAGDVLHLTLIRNGSFLEIFYPKPSQSEQTLLHVLSGDWILPFPFFAAGLIAILFIRPRTQTRLLLILFFYFFAIWISAGSISSTGYWESSLIMRSVIWLSVPVTFHLHWRFPKPFKPGKNWIVDLFYGVFVLFVILEILDLFPKNLYLIGFLFAMISALVMLIIKFFRFKEFRPTLNTLLSAYLLAMVPLVLMVILMIIGSAPPKANVALIGLTAIPGFYFFTAYRIHLRREIRQINIALRLFTAGVLIEFVLNFALLLIPPANINSAIINFLSFLTIIFIALTGFGVLLIMPALANDQIDLFKTESYTLRLSANRAVAFIIFLLLVAPLTLFLLLILPGNRVEPFIHVLTSSLISIVITGLSVLLYRYYRKAFERIVLGIKHPPEGLIRNYAQRITNSLDRNTLANLLKEEILPSLLIRESVLYFFDDHSEVKSLFKTGVSERDLQNFTNTAQIRTLAEESLQQDIQKQMPWVRLALPLRFESETIGVWCFGRKDPNEIYTPEFTEDLRSMANQTTLALLNIRQRILLQALYNANVDRQEEEKTGIARDLHDVLLPSLGYLVELQSNKCDLVEFEHAVQRINNMMREIMSGLRPSTLDMGLNIALEELADEPKAQIGGKIDIHTHLTVPEPVNYDNKAELHLYRMVQQASRNALEHAQANSIQIYGTLLRDSLNIHIEDDGIGFPFEGMPDLSTLIANRHFGLANIFERAEILHATVKIDSKPNEGTCVHIFWSPNMKG